ncbi:MAG: helicase HerA domain-containing protein [Acidimicrobiales bacterium]
MVDVPDGQLYLGETIDAEHQRTGEPVLLQAADLTTHGVIVGMTGSGKTGLGVGLVEEALLQGVPTLVLDPKGDLGNLLLTFPDLAPESFAPWVEGADPATVADAWREGLASWGIDGTRLQALRDAATFTIYTPGSTSGVGLDVVGSLRRPPEGTDAETIADEVGGFASGLLGLVGIDADPLSSREHILLANLVAHAWASGLDLDLPGLVAQVQAPPLRKLGVFELDEFFPPDDRTALALRLNGLLASPAFAAWGQGEALDLDALLTPGGRPGCAIVTLAHLSDEERQFVVTLVLSKLVTWMRRQPGTDQLRALVYFDEVVGFVPPTAAPPAKASILTLLKQARAFGIGLVLATQNPVDVDYKALSNAGTWMVGRLQTEQDKARLLDGLSSATGGVETAEVSSTIAGLDKREFVLRQAGRDTPRTFTSRWAMSYLRGPLTREQITTLMADRRATSATVAPEPTAAGPSDTAPAPAQADATPVMPTVAEGIAVRWLDPAAPWATGIGAKASGTTYAAAVVATVDLLFDDTKADLRHTEQFEGVLFPLHDPPDPTAVVAVDHDPRDLLSEAPTGAAYRIPDAAVKTKTLFSSVEKGLVAHLLATRSVALLHNPELKLYSRPGETEADFAARCEAAADTGADAAAAKVAKRMEARIKRARAAVATAEDRVAQAEATEESRSRDELLSGAGDLLGAVFGGRRSARSIASKVGTVTRRRGRANEAAQRVETARNRAHEKVEALADLEAELADELAVIGDEWDARAVAIEPLEVPLEKSDISVSQLALVWVPVS